MKPNRRQPSGAELFIAAAARLPRDGGEAWLADIRHRLAHAHTREHARTDEHPRPVEADQEQVEQAAPPDESITAHLRFTTDDDGVAWCAALDLAALLLDAAEIADRRPSVEAGQALRALAAALTDGTDTGRTGA